MRWPIILLFAASGAWAQTGAVSAAAAANPLVASSKAFYMNAKQDILRSADKMPEDKYAFRPIDTVRTYGQVLAHIADGQYEFCGEAAGKQDDKNIEQTAKTKAAIVAALKTAFAYCDEIYAGMTDTKAAETIPAFGGAKITRLGMLDFNVSHTMEHYGNLVTYLRIQGIVPPSSESQQ
ncbi:MAG: DinB family protein [Bryobacteraceae bacterium]